MANKSKTGLSPYKVALKNSDNTAQQIQLIDADNSPFISYDELADSVIESIDKASEKCIATEREIKALFN